jgi:SAM-dependent methyltransferase
VSNSEKSPVHRDRGFAAHTDERIRHWDSFARALRGWHGWGGTYHRRLAALYTHMIPPGSRVLELGCGAGDLLAAVHPSRGIGIDFSPEMIRIAGEKHPDLVFHCADAHDFAVEGPFDFVILSDLINELWDVQSALECVRSVCTPSTRIIVNTYSRLWEGVLGLAARLNLAKPVLAQNWLTRTDVTDLLHLTGFEVVNASREILLPLPLPLLAGFCNAYLARIWPFLHLCLTNFVVARPVPERPRIENPRVTVLVPARNESGNIQAIFDRVPELEAGTDLIFVEGNSTDDTYDAIVRCIAANPHRPARLFKQPGKGKGDAVRAGFDQANGDILMILDADMTVPPEDLPRFCRALMEGKGDFINGVRLVYPMEARAMRFLNFLGNKFFGLAFSWLLGQPIKDTLCGTKVLWKEDYLRIQQNRSAFGDFDPFGDFDLLFGAAKLNMKILGLPIRYRERTYGDTNINRWSHGMLLLRMTAFAARRLKFV